MKEYINPVLQVMCERGSVRNYTDRPVGDEEMKVLEQAAMAAPTSMDLQEQKFYFIRDRELLDEIAQGIIQTAVERGETEYLQRLAERDNKALFGAPLLIVIAVHIVNNYIDIDAGIAVQNIALAARSIGLDSVIMAAPDRVLTGDRAAYYTKKLGFPDGYRFAISIAVGHAAVPKEPHLHTQENIIRLG